MASGCPLRRDKPRVRASSASNPIASQSSLYGEPQLHAGTRCHGLHLGVRPAHMDKRAWTLDREWGDAGFHKNRIHEWLLQPKALLGPEYTFGRRHMGDATYSTVAP